MSDILIIDGQLTPNFKLSEFTHRKSEIYIDERFIPFVQALQEFRDWYRRPINITSGYRPVEYNKAVGGSVSSSHLVTLAIDFLLPDDFSGYSRDRKSEFYSNVLQKWSAICTDRDKFYQCNWYDRYIHLGFSLNDKISFLDKRMVR